jgi:hypothetical protein
MGLNIHKAGLILGVLVLLSGSLFQTFEGIAGPSPPQVWGLDDAYISYRYAQNLAQGNGLVFNRGERVEGYSNFLHVLMMTPAFFVTDREGVYFFSLLLNLILAAGAFLLFRKYLVNTARAPRPANILEVSGLPQEAVRRLIGFDYDFAVLVRR